MQSGLGYWKFSEYKKGSSPTWELVNKLSFQVTAVSQTQGQMCFLWNIMTRLFQQHKWYHQTNDTMNERKCTLY